MTLTHLIRFTQTLVLAAVVAALAAPAMALGGSNPSKPATDWFERYAAAHPYGQGTLAAAQPQLTDGRSPDTLDAASTAQFQVADGRSPDTLDAAQAIQPIELVSPGGFDWTDAGIGAGMGAGIITLLGVVAIALRTHRSRRVQAA